jgi:pimeloyl-ACP methyl ester carboxylesterase
VGDDAVVTYVLVHGGGFAGSCWDELVPRLDGEVLAVDLPGRGSRPAALSDIGLADFADAVVEEIGDHEDVVLVGHSLAGITLPQVTARIPGRLRHVIYVSCAVPTAGRAVADVLATFGPAAAEVAAELGAASVTTDGRLHDDLAIAMFCTGMDEPTTRSVLDRMVPEAMGPVAEPVDLAGLAADVPRTYVRLLRDASLTIPTQDEMIANLAPVDVVDLDAGHMAMISHPGQLASVLTAVAAR